MADTLSLDTGHGGQDGAEAILVGRPPLLGSSGGKLQGQGKGTPQEGGPASHQAPASSQRC